MISIALALGSQRERPPGWPAPGSPPATPAAWAALAYCAQEELATMGCRLWDDTGLMLLPGEWHAALPEGLALESISGKRVIVGRDYIDNDIRFGCLAYGVRAAT